VIAALFVATRHFGDHRTEVPIDTVFKRARRPAPEQGFLARVFDPDHSRELRTKIQSVRYAEGERVILADGNMLELAGVRDAMALFREASGYNKAPAFDADIVDGSVRVGQVTAGSAVLARDITLRRVAKLPPSAVKPDRHDVPSDDGYWEQEVLPHDSEAYLRDLVGEKISVTGRLVRDEEDRLVLMTHQNTGIVLEVNDRARSIRALFDAFVDTGEELQVDMTLRSLFPWIDSEQPERSRRTTKLIGVGRTASASAQNYHVSL
jgi:hypothetical protein